MERSKQSRSGNGWKALISVIVAGLVLLVISGTESTGQNKAGVVSPSSKAKGDGAVSTKAGGASTASSQMKAQSEIPVENQRLIPATKPVDITGEVVDAWCYTSQVMGPGRGEKHKACALACAHGGVTLGIVDEKTNELFIAAKYRGYTGCKELLLPFVAKRVKVKGWVARKGGCTLLKIKTVELAR